MTTVHLVTGGGRGIGRVEAAQDWVASYQAGSRLRAVRGEASQP